MDRDGRLAAAFALALACAGCPAGAKDPPPPDEGSAIASAAPRALGAMAGGTDAAPPPVMAPRLPSEGPEGMPMPELEADAGIEPEDAGAANGELPL